MRARRKLAEVLLSLGRVPEAVEHLHAMIDADPRDREGVRFVLLTTLLEAGRDEEAWNLLGHDAIEFDAGCAKDYARALLSFRRDGSSEAAERDLSVAIEANPLAAAFLAGRLEAPEPPRYYSSGMAGEEEAAGVAFDQGAPWRQTAGAVEWLGVRLSAEFPDVSVETCGPLRPGVISTARSSVGVTSFGGPGVSRAS